MFNNRWSSGFTKRSGAPVQNEKENHKMQNKMFTLTATLIALLGLSLFVMAQDKSKKAPPTAIKNAEIAKKGPAPAATFLKCETENKEFGQYIHVTNTTGQSVPAGKTIQYTVKSMKGNFKLASNLAANATLKQSSVPYEGNPTCKAWF
jgi:hypothetical protein